MTREKFTLLECNFTTFLTKYLHFLQIIVNIFSLYTMILFNLLMQTLTITLLLLVRQMHIFAATRLTKQYDLV